MAVEDGFAYAIVVGRSSAGKVGLFVDAEQRWAVQNVAVAVVVALSAAGLKDIVAVHLLRIELVEWRCCCLGGAAAEQQRIEGREQAEERKPSGPRALRARCRYGWVHSLLTMVSL